MYKDDAISREYCLDTIAKLPLNWEYGLGVEDCYKIVENAPSIDGQVCKWISVEDMLPKNGQIVFCYTKYFYEVLQWDDDSEQWCGQNSVNEKHYVTHWMPIPEPPKED